MNEGLGSDSLVQRPLVQLPHAAAATATQPTPALARLLRQVPETELLAMSADKLQSRLRQLEVEAAKLDSRYARDRRTMTRDERLVCGFFALVCISEGWRNIC